MPTRHTRFVFRPLLGATNPWTGRYLRSHLKYFPRFVFCNLERQSQGLTPEKKYTITSFQVGWDLYRAIPAVTRDLGLHSLIRRTAPYSRLLRWARGTDDIVILLHMYLYFKKCNMIVMKAGLNLNLLFFCLFSSLFRFSQVHRDSMVYESEHWNKWWDVILWKTLMKFSGEIQNFINNSSTWNISCINICQFGCSKYKHCIWVICYIYLPL